MKAIYTDKFIIPVDSIRNIDKFTPRAIRITLKPYVDGDSSFRYITYDYEDECTEAFQNMIDTLNGEDA